jgi:hypothetical protein
MLKRLFLLLLFVAIVTTSLRADNGSFAGIYARIARTSGFSGTWDSTNEKAGPRRNESSRTESTTVNKP